MLNYDESILIFNNIANIIRFIEFIEQNRNKKEKEEQKIYEEIDNIPF
jgi:hypothetical protein